MYKFLISSLVLSLQVSVIQTCNRSLVKRSYDVPVNQVIISTNSSLASIRSSSNTSLPALDRTRFDNKFEPQSDAAYNKRDRPREESHDQTSFSTGHENGEIDLATLRIEYNKYKILSSLGIRTDPENLASSGHERLAQLEASKHLISDIKGTELRNLNTNVSILSVASIVWTCFLSVKVKDQVVQTGS